MFDHLSWQSLAIVERCFPMTDFDIINHGTVAQIVPNTLAAEVWLRDNVEAESWQHMGRTVCIEPHYALPTMAGITEAGFTQALNGEECEVLPC